MDQVIMILEDRDLRPAWLCRQAGISYALFTLMKKGERTITESTREKFAEILGVPQEILFNKGENK